MENSTDPVATAAIIKSDRTGRTRYTRQYKQEVLDAFQSSSLSAPAFARYCGIKYPTFAAWVAAAKRTAPAEPVSAAARPAFLLAEVGQGDDDAILEVRLPGGSLARVGSPAQIKLLAELLNRLA